MSKNRGYFTYTSEGIATTYGTRNTIWYRLLDLFEKFHFLYISILPYLVLMHTRCIIFLATQLRGIEGPYMTPKDQFWGIVKRGPKGPETY